MPERTMAYRNAHHARGVRRRRNASSLWCPSPRRSPSGRRNMFPRIQVVAHGDSLAHLVIEILRRGDVPLDGRLVGQGRPERDESSMKHGAMPYLIWWLLLGLDLVVGVPQAAVTSYRLRPRFVWQTRPHEGRSRAFENPPHNTLRHSVRLGAVWCGYVVAASQLVGC